jgi:hypothetical protein
MEERETRRLHLGSELMKLTRSGRGRGMLPPLREDGVAPFVIGLPDASFLTDTVPAVPA